jgi:signal transduction histidine kinase
MMIIVSLIFPGAARFVTTCCTAACRHAGLLNRPDGACARAYYGGAVEVRLREAGQNVVIAIDDSGPGILEAEREQVFASFYRREHSRSRKTGGAGLGLSVARTVIRGHGGEITLATRPEGGLRQEVVLPRPLRN